MLKKILFVLLAGILFLVVVGFFLPTTYQVERTTVINAPPAAIHAYVNDLNRWDEWEPWREDDPSVTVKRDGKTVGIGASQSWTSASGDGRLTFTDSNQEQGIRYSMLFDNQWPAKAAIQYEPQAGGTAVTWSMAGGEDSPKVIGGYFALAMDGMIGPFFERGLEKLKARVEAQ